MIQSYFSNLVFEPVIPLFVIFLGFIFFFSSIFFALLNKSTGIIYRVIIYLLLNILILQPSYKIEERKIENDIITFVIDKTLSQEVTNRVKETELIYESLLKKLKKYKGIDILEIKVDNDFIYKRYGNLDEIINGKVVQKKTKNKKKYSSNLIQNLEKNLNQYPSKKLSSIFILSDGQIHDLQKKNRFDKIDVPIYFLLIGEKKINDRKLSIISHPEFGFLNDEISIKIQGKDFLDKNSSMDLYLQNGDRKTKSYKIKNNEIKEIKLKLSKTGENFIGLKIKPRKEELSNSNNSKSIKVFGIRKKLRVLLISGEPYMGTRVWRNFLKSDPSVELIHMTVLRPPEKNDNTPVNELSLIPFPIKELFEEKLDKFQLIIFDNFKGKNVLTPVYIQNLLSFLDEGGGILEITGPSYNSRSSLFRTEVGRILPGTPSGKILRGEYKPVLSELGKIHPITESLFKSNQNYGSWYEMNKISQVDEDALILMEGSDKNPLLVVKKINKGRIAQIYSHHIWLWTKKNNLDGGPHNKLIKNLAHWLMKEPSLEENKINISIDEKKIIVKKSFLLAPNKNELNLNIIDPNGKKHKLFLKKINELTYKAQFSIKVPGFYLVTDGNIDLGIHTLGTENIELQNLNLTDKIIKVNNLSNYFSKAIWLEDNKMPKFKEIEELDSNAKKDNFLYFLRNNNFVIESLTNKKLFNSLLIIFIVMILLLRCWKKESS